MSANSKQFTEKLLQYKVNILWVIVIILAVYFIYFAITNADRPTHGFASHYTASRLLSEGEEVSRFYDDGWFSVNVKRFVPEVYEIYYFNLPTTSLMMLPLVMFDYNTARIIWTIFNFIILLFAVGFLIQKFIYKEFWTPLILILFLSFQPLYANFLFGQAYILVFSILIIAWYAYNNDNDKLLGFAIGLIFVLKSTTFIFWIFLLVQKRWKSLIWGLATMFAIIILSLPWIGLDAWQTYVGKIPGFVSIPSLSVTAYQTIHSFFHHLTTYNQRWNPDPLFNLPLLGNFLSTFCVLIVLVASSYKALSLKKSELAFGAFLIAGVIISPASLDYHYILLLLPILVLINRIRKDPSVLLWILLLVFTAMIAANLHYTSPRIATGVWAIFAYPKLYGAIGLWGLYMSILYRYPIKGN